MTMPMSDIPITRARGGGGTGGRRRNLLDSAGIVGIAETLRLALYPNETSALHMTDWRYFNGVWRQNGNGEIAEVITTKAEHGGFSVRRPKNARTHLHVPFHGVDINEVDHPDLTDLGIVVSVVAEDGSVIYRLPKLIAGSGPNNQGKYFKITPRS
jgi:hypothetical protein